jgi:predicted ATPase with chaperone activity
MPMNQPAQHSYTRDLHHTISDVGLIGVGQIPMPGEVSRVVR